MVIFNELRICEDGRSLIIDCEIEGVDIYSKMYISRIWLEYYKNASAAGMPSSKAHLIYENKDNNKRIRSRRITYTAADAMMAPFNIADFNGALFYVIVECDGVLDPTVGNMPCGYDQTTDIGVVLDWRSFYARGMNYVHSMVDGCGNLCEPSDAFMHFIILWNGLKLAIDTCDWDAVRDIWDKIKLSPERVSSGSGSGVFGNNGCGCR